MHSSFTSNRPPYEQCNADIYERLEESEEDEKSRGSEKRERNAGNNSSSRFRLDAIIPSNELKISDRWRERVWLRVRGCSYHRLDIETASRSLPFDSSQGLESVETASNG